MRVVEIFKGHKKEEMYLYVDQKEGLKKVPDDLLETFGRTESVMVMPLTKDKKLARVKASDVLEGIEKQVGILPKDWKAALVSPAKKPAPKKK